MISRRPTALALGVLSLWIGATACAPPLAPPKFDPGLRWRTLTTEHFRIAFHQGEEAQARDAAVAAEEAHARLTSFFDWRPEAKTWIVLVDVADEPFGAATPFPVNTIIIDPTSPAAVGGLPHPVRYQNWLRLVILHEYVHILHLDRVASVPQTFRRIFGRVIFPNLWQPTWMIEGLATYLETEEGRSDRGNGAFTEMLLRAAVLEGRLNPIDQANRLDMWPDGLIPYLYGAEFHAFIAKKYGKEKIAELAKQYSAQLIPFMVESNAYTVLMDSLSRLWGEWELALRDRFTRQRAELEKQGLTPTRVLIPGHDWLLGPRVSPDGRMVAYSRFDPHGFPAIRLYDLETGKDRPLARRHSGGTVSWSPDGRSIVFAQLEVRRNFSFFSDLYRHDLARRRTRRLTRGARALDPDWSPDGRTIAFIQNRAGVTNLALLDLGTRAITALTAQTDTSIQFSAPRWSPDGKRIAFGIWKDGKQDIALFDTEERSIRNLTDDAATDLSPSWTRDGDEIVFSSDRSGIFNLYAYRLSDGSIRRLTNVLYGAFSPDPLAKGGPVFAGYDNRGLRLEQLAAASSAGAGAPAPPVPGIARDAGRSDPPAPAVVPPSEPYRPLRELRPRFWIPFPLPWLVTTDELGLQVGAQTGAHDPLGRHTYLGIALYGFQTRRAAYALDYYYDRFLPTLHFGIGDLATPHDELVADPLGPVTYWERRRALEADIVVPFQHFTWGQALRVGYVHRRLDRLLPETSVPIVPLPFQGSIAGARLTWILSNAKEYPFSTGNEEGRTLTLTHERDLASLGSDLELTRWIADWREYFPVPAWTHHTVALRAAGGVSHGDPFPQGVFELGGPGLLEALLLEPEETVLPLRGYPSRSQRGQRAMIGSVEYRAPIQNVEHGFELRPFFLKRVHAGVFLDGGAAWDSGVDPRALYGIGAELKADLDLFYHFPSRMRLGIAHGLSAGGENQVYLAFGNAF